MLSFRIPVAKEAAGLSTYGILSLSMGPRFREDDGGLCARCRTPVQ